jgi:glycosyltransferase involved in cell wall biosynthesis
VSQATVDDLVRLGVAARAKFDVIPVGLDLGPFLVAGPDAGAGFRREAGVRPNEVLLTFVGRLVRIKRVDLLLSAVARARDLGAPVRLAVVGDGGERQTLERLAGELGISGHVFFAGYRADMAGVAAAADLAVLSSDNEGTPVWLIEAAAAGTPAVAVSVGGVPEVVTPDTGLLAPPRDSESLGRAMAALSLNGEWRAKLGEAARCHVAERFSAERLVRDIENLYDVLSRPTWVTV